MSPAFSQGSNYLYSLTLPGHALTVPGTYHGNLQIGVATTPSFASQLGNCPLSLPYTVTVAAAPPSVTGSSLVTNLQFNAVSGAITPVRVASAPSVLEAILPNGSVVPGTYDGNTGAFTIPRVPIGNYILHLGDTYLWTSSRNVNMDWARGGRDAYYEGNATLRTFVLSNLTAWDTGDYLLAYDFNSELYRTWSDVANGLTSVDAILPWQDWPLVDTTLGDAPRIVQYATTTNGTVQTVNPVASGNVPAISMVAGFATTTLVPFSALPATDSVPVNFKRFQFAAYRSAYNPNATIPKGPFFYVDSTPGAAAYGAPGEWLDGYAWQDTNPANTTDVSLGNQPTPMVPAGFERIYYAGESHSLSLTAPGANSAFTYTVKGTRSYTLTPPSSSAPMEVLVSPVTSPTINGNSLFQDQTGVGLTPTLAWTAPALGNPNLYLLRIYKLENQSGTTSSTLMGRLFLAGSATSVTLPAGILANGCTYTFQINAYVDGGYNLATAPWASFRFPYGCSQIQSNRVTP